MPTDYDFVQLYVRLENLDKELKELRKEVGGIDLISPVYNNDGIQDYNFYRRHFVNNNKPVQWPYETYTDYLKRIGEYNEAQIYEDDTK